MWIVKQKIENKRNLFKKSTLNLPISTKGLSMESSQVGGDEQQDWRKW